MNQWSNHSTTSLVLKTLNKTNPMASLCNLLITYALKPCYSFTVMTTKQAADALCIMRDQQHKIDLVIIEAYLLDMDKYELLETIRNISSLPIIGKYLPFNYLFLLIKNI